MLQLTSDSFEDGFAIQLRDATAPTGSPVWAVFSATGQGGIAIRLYDTRPTHVVEEGALAEVNLDFTNNQVILTYADETVVDKHWLAPILATLVGQVEYRGQKSRVTRPLFPQPVPQSQAQSRQLPLGSRLLTPQRPIGNGRNFRPAGADQYAWSVKRV